MASINSLMVQGAWDNPIPIPISGTVSTVPAAGGTTTVTGTVTAVPTLTTTVAGTVTATVTGNVTSTPAPLTTVTVVGTVTAVPTLTTTVTGTVTLTQTVTVTGTVTATVTGTVTAVPTLTTTVTGTVSANVTNTVSDNIAQWNGVAVSSPVAAGDSVANPTAPQLLSHLELWDPANTVWLRSQPAFGGILLASASRNATTVAALPLTRNARGLRLYISVTAISASVSLLPALNANDNSNTVSAALWTAAAGITTVTLAVYEFYPGASAAVAGSVKERVQIPPAIRWVLTITPSGGTSTATYAVYYDVLY